MQGLDLEKLSQKDLDDIRLDLVKRYLPNGNRLRYAAINLFCREILKRKDLYLKIPRSEVKNKDVLTDEQVEKIISVAKTRGKEVYAVILTLYDCALRKTEICNLNVDDVSFDTSEILLRNTKTGDKIVAMTSRVSKAIADYLLYERKTRDKNEKALFLNRYGARIGEHFVRNHLKECAVLSGIKKRVYPQMIRASCITHLLNEGVNPLTVQIHARHTDFRTTMIYNRPTQQRMRQDIERVFVKKETLSDEDRQRAIFDRYLKGDISLKELMHILEVTRPKTFKGELELTGYA
jgi:site-specific recombinase XerD